MILVGLKPLFPRLSPRVRRCWLTAHVGISVGWLGLSLAMTTLAVTGMLAGTDAVLHGAYQLMHIFDLAIVIPSVLLSIISGVVVTLGWPFGLVKHWWALVKFVISLTIPTVAAFESRWVIALAERTQDPAADPGRARRRPGRLHGLLRHTAVDGDGVVGRQTMGKDALGTQGLLGAQG